MNIYSAIFLVVTLLSSVAVYGLWDIIKIFWPPELPLIEDVWWGSGDAVDEDLSIYPFRINVSDDVLQDLRYRLDHTRGISKPLEQSQWYGFNGVLAEEILNYWKTNYTWKMREKYLNKFPQFTSNIQGLNIHFIHVKPENVPGNYKILPLLMMHGWPSSVREFYEIIPILTTPQKDQNFVFEVIVPSLPGFGFSEGAKRPGLGPSAMALIFKKLMNRLGFEKYYIQGGDMGSFVLHGMAVNFEDNILGFHNTMCLTFHPISIIKLIIGSLYPSWIGHKDDVELYYPVKDSIKLLALETGYLHIQATKPDSIGIAFDDSPMGLASYVLEKYSTGGDFNFRARQDGGLLEKFTYDALLDNIMLYWINKSSTKAFRFYAETFNTKEFPRIFWTPIKKIPVACFRSKYDFVAPDGLIGDMYYNLVQVSDNPGGHFPALEYPEVLAADIFSSINKIEKEISKKD